MYLLRMSRFGFLDLPTCQVFWVTASSTVLSRVYASLQSAIILSFWHSAARVTPEAPNMSQKVVIFVMGEIVPKTEIFGTEYRGIAKNLGMVRQTTSYGSVCGSGLSCLQLVAVPRTSYDEQRIEVTAAGHLNP